MTIIVMSSANSLFLAPGSKSARKDLVMPSFAQSLSRDVYKMLKQTRKEIVKIFKHTCGLN